MYSWVAPASGRLRVQCKSHFADVQGLNEADVPKESWKLRNDISLLNDDCMGAHSTQSERPAKAQRKTRLITCHTDPSKIH